MMSNQSASKILCLTIGRLGLSALLVLPSLAASQMIDAGRCAHIADRLARFDCYESLVEQAREQEGEGRPQAASRAAPAPAPAPVEQEAWVPPVRETRAERESREEPRREFRGTVAELKEHGHRRWRITLENGQVWQQMISERYALREGHQVRIYPTGFGKAFRLSADEVSGYIQVERVK